MRIFAASSELQNVASVWASSETKAIEAAGIFAGAYGLPINVEHRLHENDRSATGFLPPAEFELVANQFFANPNESVRGWETAVAAQNRVLAAFEAIVATSDAEGDIAIIAHGGVGTLLLCHLLRVPIDRCYDQPFQGHYWICAAETRKVLKLWKSIAPR